jgi:hypothetical protein
MIQRILAACLSVALIFLASQARAQHPIEHVFRYDMQNIGDVWAQQYASGRPWHGNYYYQGTGQPTALVVPPNSVMHQTYSWGVSTELLASDLSPVWISRNAIAGRRLFRHPDLAKQYPAVRCLSGPCTLVDSQPRLQIFLLSRTAQ